MTPMKWFYSFIKPYRKRLFLGLFLVTFLAGLAIINPIVSGKVVDDVISGGQYHKLPVLVAILLLVTAVRSVLRFLVPYNFEICSQGVLYKMRDRFTESS